MLPFAHSVFFFFRRQRFDSVGARPFTRGVSAPNSHFPRAYLYYPFSRFRYPTSIQQLFLSGQKNQSVDRRYYLSAPSSFHREPIFVHERTMRFSKPLCHHSSSLAAHPSYFFSFVAFLSILFLTSVDLSLTCLRARLQ